MGEEQHDDLVGQLAGPLGQVPWPACGGRNLPRTSAVVIGRPPGTSTRAGLRTSRHSAATEAAIDRRHAAQPAIDSAMNTSWSAGRHREALVQVDRDVRQVHAEDPDRPALDVLAREQQLGDEAEDGCRGVGVGDRRVGRRVEEGPERERAGDRREDERDTQARRRVRDRELVAARARP